ncbi:glycerol-3-phosphate acyltransferase 1 [Impatiens glandulifera]|uniref:glycerol-3-phosphate acyltransferase 1 n=1 Tax=Impatiens glandulifera TaxID=253017 RepID=UPI001FB1437A|nr:glycerol-3-phosphate acyltransferase 1 [Impatiens glandulifera]
MAVLKIAEWLLYQLLAISCYKAAMKMRNYGSYFRNPFLRSTQQPPPLYPTVSKCTLQNRENQTLVCDIDHGTLLKNSNSSFFPFFMLVAFEGGSIFRAFLLLLTCPVLWVLNHDLKLKVMIFVTFVGLRLKDMESVGRAVLPKFYLDNLNLDVYEVFASTGSRVVLTTVPRVLVEGFLKEYLEVGKVLGTELQTYGNYFTGFLSGSGLLVKNKAFNDLFEDQKKPDLGLGSSSVHDHLFLSQCKEAYVVITNEESKNTNVYNSIIKREKNPKPIVFHDGRLAFLPTPMATLAMFIWLPLGFVLAIFRLSIGIFLPYKAVSFIGNLSGVKIIVKGIQNIEDPTKTTNKGVLYVCTHRTLLDPVFLSTSLRKPLTAVTYSLSKMSEILAPIKTVRLTRDRKRDGSTMERLLKEGDLVVCPEGTTCREPFLLRFSSLFAELTDEIVPVAMNTKVSMFYGTTASGLKCLDPIFFLMNPRPAYYVNILEKVPKEKTCAGGMTSFEVANYIQKQLGNALGFECTTLTRRDKYLMLAGNEGIVERDNNTREKKGRV